MRPLTVTLRALWRHRGPSCTIVLTLAVTIAGATVVYSVLDLCWHFIPAVNQHGRVFVSSTDPRPELARAGVYGGVAWTGMSVADLADLTTRSHTVDEFAAFTFTTATLTERGQPERVSAIRATPNLLSSWGVSPALGRGFRSGEGRPGTDPTVLLTPSFWRTHFAAAPSAIGQQLTLDGVPHAIVGVLPASLAKGIFTGQDVMIPLDVTPAAAARDDRQLFVTGVLKAGVRREQAAADLERIARQLATEYPRTNARSGIVVRPLIEMLGGNLPMLLRLLMLVVALLIGIACANVSNVTLATLATRKREFALRAALGAGWRRQMLQLLAENLLLSLAAAAIGVVLAWAGIAGIQALDPTGDSFGSVSLNARVLAAALGIALLIPIGVVAATSSRPSLSVDVLRHGQSGTGEDRSPRRLRHGLVALQMALAVFLLIQIGAIARTGWTLATGETGFDRENLLTFRLELAPARFGSDSLVNGFLDEVLRRLQTIPGVTSAAVANRMPIADREEVARIRVDGTASLPEEMRTVTVARISDRFLETLKIPVIHGRGLDATDLSARRRVALISEAAARRYWPGEDPIGARVAIGDAAAPDWLEVVGTVRDVRNSDADRASPAQIYLPISLDPPNALAFVLRTRDGDPAGFAPAVRAEVAAVDGGEPVFAIDTMQHVIYHDVQGTILLVSVLMGIATISLSLAAAGIYGLTSYSVMRRTPEIGVRMALGARPASVLGVVLSQAVRPVALGVVLGTAGAMAVASFASAAVTDVNFLDPISYAVTICVLSVVAMLAIVVPARKAAQLNPAAALRTE